jgi:ArsR family transcriptional regulator, arsenate/arsenite/antimonite-responsive transcriptional repressor
MVASDQTAHWLERVFIALSDSQRTRILSIVAEYEVSVSYLVEVLHTVQPIVSRHLAYLREAGLVEAGREGKWVRYRLRLPDNECAAALVSDALRHLKQTRQTQSDLARVAAWSERRNGPLKNAPKPERIIR